MSRTNTINGAAVRRRRIAGKPRSYTVELDDGGGWWKVGRVDGLAGGAWKWRAYTGGKGDLTGQTTTLGEAVDTCAHRWMQERIREKTP